MKNKFPWLTLLLAAGLVVLGARLACLETERENQNNDDAGGSQTIDNIMTRTSVRRFTDEAPLDSAVQTLLKAGMAAHSSGNKQPWRMIVVVDDEVRDSIAAAAHNLKSVGAAPVAIVVCGVPGETFQGEGDGYWVADCSAMAQNINLAAHAMGMGASICAVYPREARVRKVSRLLNLPDSIVPFAVVPVGFPNAACTAKDKWDESKVSYL